MFMEESARNRKLIAADCQKLLSDVQKLKFSPDGRFIAAVNQNGTRISILELITDSKKSI